MDEEIEWSDEELMDAIQESLRRMCGRTRESGL